MSAVQQTTSSSDEIIPGDIVAVNHGAYGRREGLVIGSSVDSYGRQVVEIQFEPGEIYKTWYPHVRRVRRTVSYRDASLPLPHKRTVERTFYW